MPTKNYSAKAAKTIGKVILIFFVLSVIVVLSFKYLNSESVSIYDKSFNDIVDNSYSQVDHALITYSDGRLNMIRHIEEFDLGNHTYKKIDNIDENEKLNIMIFMIRMITFCLQQKNIQITKLKFIQILL